MFILKRLFKYPVFVDETTTNEDIAGLSNREYTNDELWDVIAEDFTLALRELHFSPATYVVVITRGHEHDVECLFEILNKKTQYVGLIGSRRRVRLVLEMLGKEGFSPKRLKEVFTPIGLPIGAESPEEIALSILSELVCVRRKGTAQALALRAAVGMEL